MTTLNKNWRRRRQWHQQNNYCRKLIACVSLIKYMEQESNFGKEHTRTQTSQPLISHWKTISKKLNRAQKRCVVVVWCSHCCVLNEFVAFRTHQLPIFECLFYHQKIYISTAIYPYGASALVLVPALLYMIAFVRGQHGQAKRSKQKEKIKIKDEK